MFYKQVMDFFFKFIKYDKNNHYGNKEAIIKELKKEYECLEIEDEKDPHDIKEVVLKSYDPTVTNSFIN